MLETSQIQTLVTVTNAKSFSKAAEQLGVTQSAISQSIKNIENKFNITIFKRSGKNVVLTPSGEKLYKFGNQFLNEMKETIEDLQHDKISMKGKVRIGTLTGIGKSWLAHEVVGYAKKNPDLKLSVQMGQQADLIKDFDNNLLDILIMPEDALPTHGEFEFLLEEISILVFPKNHNDFDLVGKLNLKKLEVLPTVLFDSNDFLFTKWCRTKFKSIPKKMNICFKVNSHGHMLEAVHGGLGVAVIPKHVLNRSYFKDKVSTLGPDFECSTGKLFIVYQKESRNLLRIQKTIQYLIANRDSFKI